MADLVESNIWENGIYQLEQTDPVLGGPPNLNLSQGMANVQPLQLANRTLYLRELIEDGLAALALLNQIKTVDGHGSGLNADMVDGKHYSQIVTDITAALIDAAPGTLDTLNELAAALGDDPNFAASMTAALAERALLEDGFRNYGAGDDDIISLVPGTTSGRIFEGDPGSHVVVGIKSNSDSDGFHIVSTGSDETGDYVQVLASVTRAAAEFANNVTAKGDLEAHGGTVEIRTAPGGNASIFLRGQGGSEKARLYWSRGTGDVVLRRYNDDGDVEGEMRIDDNAALRMNGHNVWHEGDAVSQFGANGYQRLPSGLIIQWGIGSVANNGTINFPIAFPNACLDVKLTDSNVGGNLTNAQYVGVSAVDATSVTVSIFDLDGTPAVGANGTRFFAIGH